ncbi:MAG: ATP-binding cassette domain-containing protein [Firmicutes bacterium]|nr:ATP-binding cassette domain-containing protein [Bacillota bacterium]
MGFFNNQIEQRRLQDEDQFAQAFDSIAQAIIGDSIRRKINDSQVARSAFEDVLKYYHIKIRDIEIPNYIKDVDEQFDYLLECYGLMCRKVKLTDTWYKDAYGPMLAREKDDDEVVALIPDTFSGYHYLDTDTGKTIHIHKRNIDSIQKDAICFYKPFPSKSLTIKDLYVYMFSIYSASDIIYTLGIMGLITLIGMLNPYLTKLLFSTVVQSQSVRVLVALTIYMLSVSLSMMLLSSASTLINQKLSHKQAMGIEAAVMMRILNLPSSFFSQYNSGELSQRLDYVNSLCSTLMNSIVTTGLSSLFSLIYIGQIFTFAPALVVPSICITIVTLLFSVVSTLVQTKITKKSMDISTQEYGMAYSILSGIQKIKLAGAEKRAFAKWADSYSKELKMLYNPPLFIKINSVLSTGIGLIGTLVMYALAIRSQVSVENYVAFNASYGMIEAAFSQMSSIALTIATIKPILDMAKPILETVPDNGEDKDMVNRLSGSIELNNVSFRYNPDMPYVLKDLNLKIKSGEYVAICGTTGCGKSTLLRLMLGFETPEKGAVYYDNRNINRLNLKTLRKHIGCVMQNGELFQGDLFSNITISHPQLTLDDAWNAAAIAHIDEDIERMPMGMNTLIAEGAKGISGGQKQRLLIARAVVGKPKILMFDEATSALDNITQKQVSQSLDALRCTRIVIAHRLSTIRHCDRIIVIDDGRIVEDGTYEQLIQNHGLFAELVERQKVEEI